ADVEIAPGGRQRTLRLVPYGRRVRRIHPRFVSRPRNRTTLECAQVRAEARRARIREVVIIHRLRTQGFLCARHCDVEKAVHGGGDQRTADSGQCCPEAASLSTRSIISCLILISLLLFASHLPSAIRCAPFTQHRASEC